MNRVLIAVLIFLPAALRAQSPAPSPSPDWKAAYEQANGAAKGWRDQAEALTRENAALKDQVALLTEHRPADTVNRARNLALAPIFAIRGKVLSVMPKGILVTCEPNTYVPDRLCFVELETTKGMLDGQTFTANVANIFEPYEYTAASGARRTIPKFCMPPAQAIATPPPPPKLPPAPTP